jgi:plasmid stabilization system protein ParE
LQRRQTAISRHYGLERRAFRPLRGLDRQALIDLGDDPFRPGAKHRYELPEEIYVYHLASSRERVAGDRVKATRHFLKYRVVAVRVEVLSILHDSWDLAQHLPQA